MIVRTDRIDGNQRYSWIKNQRSLFVIRSVTVHFAPQNDQLMLERRILGLKPALRLELRCQDGQEETEQGAHCPLTLGDSSANQRG